MNRLFPWRLAAFVLLLVAVAPASPRPHLFRGRFRSPVPVESLPPLLAPAIPAVNAGPVTSPQLLAEPAIPKTLVPSADQFLLHAYRAEGVQIYECRPSQKDPKVFEWVFLGPEATLFDDQGNKAGTHGAGPSWVANDGSKIVAAKIAGADAPGGRAIPWLLLRVEFSAGSGPLSKTTFIQRVDTWAGLAPKTGAIKENAGKQLRIRYQATYRFFGPANAPGINATPALPVCSR